MHVPSRVKVLSSSASLMYVGAYFALWCMALVLLHSLYQFEMTEAAFALVVLGLALPALSLLTTRRGSALPLTVRRPALETNVLLGYLVFVAAVLVWGLAAVARIQSEPAHALVLLVVKLAVFVAVPAVIFFALGYRAGNLAPVSFSWKALKPALWLSLAVTVMQMFLGRGLADIRSAHLPAATLCVGAPLVFLWLVIEVGLVEEFFFRALLQERLAAILGSRWGGLVVSALLFGLVHAPGMYLRTAATNESLGAHPSLLYAAGYSIVLTSLAGLALGVLWLRTKNLAVVVLVHAANDLLPNLIPVIKAFHLAS